jgi:hypothetical protein
LKKIVDEKDIKKTRIISSNSFTKEGSSASPCMAQQAALLKGSAMAMLNIT